MIVVDASAAPETLHAPHPIDHEVAPARGRHAFADFADLAIHRYPHSILLPRIRALRGSLTACDAAYVALAEALDAPLVTRDRKLAAAGGHDARVELV